MAKLTPPVTQGCAQRVGFAVEKYSTGLVPELIFHGQTFYWEDICGLTYGEKATGDKTKIGHGSVEAQRKRINDKRKAHSEETHPDYAGAPQHSSSSQRF
jgi:hypothetical protein